jgi:hypothetical protein
MHDLESEMTGNFPPEFVSPKDKEKPEYGLQYARAMYGTSNRMGPRFFYDDDEYNSLIEVAQGRQSVDGIKRLYGHYRDQWGVQDDSDSLAYIDVQVLNLGPKYINRAVAKMQKYSYELSVDAVDPVSVDEKEAYAASLQAFYQTNQWLMEMNINAQEMFPELDVTMLPKFLDEMMFDATINPKIKKEIWAELALTLLQYVNEFQQKMREVDWDIVVLGKGHMHFYEDENGVPRCERVNPKHHIGSYVDNENFTDQEYAGFYDWITPNQLTKEMLASGESPEKIKEVIDRWTYDVPPSTNMSGNFDRYDGLVYIPVMRFYFRSEDNRSFVISKNERYGFDQMFEKSYNYEPEETVQQYFKEGSRKLRKLSYTSIYGGTWVLDSDIVYNYGRKKLPRTNLVNARLPIVTFAPNMKEGRVVSFFSQMIEPIFMINVAHNKIKEILAKGWMGLREIDFAQLEGINLGKGGQAWTPRQVYEFILKTNVVPKRSIMNQHSQNTFGRTVEEVQTGVLLADYFQTLDKYIGLLDQMTSTSIVDSIQMPDRLSATAAKQSSQTSDIDMEWLYNAHEEMYRQGSHMFLLMMQEMKRDGKKVTEFVPALGKAAMRFWEDDVPYCELGLMLRRKPTEEMWASFYQDVQIALQNQEIGLADSVYLREIDNLKQARQMMVVRSKQYKRDKQQEAKFNNDLAIQSNQAAAESKLQGELMKEQTKFQLNRELEILKGRIKLMGIDADKRFEMELQTIENQSRERVSREQVTGSVIKENMRRKSLEYQSNSRLQEAVMREANKAQVEQKKLDAPKPKTSSK